MSNQYDGVLSDTLAMVNTIRGAFGHDALDELPSASPGDAGDCVYARAFRPLGAQSVGGNGRVQFQDAEVAEKVALLSGGRLDRGDVVMPPQFASVIAAFDNRQLPQLGRKV